MSKAGIEETTGDGLTELGRRLFFDPILSSNGKVSCATCHDPAKGYSSGGLAPRLGGGSLDLRAPSLLNRGTGRRFFWDGRATSLEDQAKEVIANPREMGGPLSAAVARVTAKYPSIRDADGLVGALAAYERTLASPPTRFDAYRAGKNQLSLTEGEARGWDLFRGLAGCYKCHTGSAFTDDQTHDTGTGGRFKTPGLRGAKLFERYGHDARFADLREVIDHYDVGGGEVKPLRLTEQQKADLLAFLKSL